MLITAVYSRSTFSGRSFHLSQSAIIAVGVRSTRDNQVAKRREYESYEWVTSDTLRAVDYRLSELKYIRNQLRRYFPTSMAKKFGSSSRSGKCW
jgi:hypothetical protein